MSSPIICCNTSFAQTQGWTDASSLPSIAATSRAKRRISDEDTKCNPPKRKTRNSSKPKQTRRTKKNSRAGRKIEILSFDDGFSLTVCKHLRKGLSLPLINVAGFFDKWSGESYAILIHRGPLQPSSNTHLHMKHYPETQVLYLIGWGGNTVLGDCFPIVFVQEARQLAKKKADGTADASQLVKPSPQEYEKIFEKLPLIGAGHFDLLGSRVFGPETSSFSPCSSTIDDYIGNYCRLKKVVPDTCSTFRVWAYRLVADAYRLVADAFPLTANRPSPSQILRIDIITRWQHVPAPEEEPAPALTSSSPALSDADSLSFSSSFSNCSSVVSSPHSISFPVQAPLDQDMSCSPSQRQALLSRLDLSDMSDVDTDATSPFSSFCSLQSTSHFGEHPYENSENCFNSSEQPSDYSDPFNSSDLTLDSNSETNCSFESPSSPFDSSSSSSGACVDLDVSDYNSNSTGISFAGQEETADQSLTKIGFLLQSPSNARNEMDWVGLDFEPLCPALVAAGDFSSSAAVLGTTASNNTEHSVHASPFIANNEAKIMLYFGVTPYSETAFTRQFNRTLRKVNDNIIDETFHQGCKSADDFLNDSLKTRYLSAQQAATLLRLRVSFSEEGASLPASHPVGPPAFRL